MLLMIDNYDSFTYNTCSTWANWAPRWLCTGMTRSPWSRSGNWARSASSSRRGPAPDEAGISMDVVRRFGPTTPLLGICLGHQSIGQAFGGDVVRARQVMHGKTSMIHHGGKGVLSRLPEPFEATRYHSLILARDYLPEGLEVTAWTDATGSSTRSWACAIANTPSKGYSSTRIDIHEDRARPAAQLPGWNHQRCELKKPWLAYLTAGA